MVAKEVCAKHAETAENIRGEEFANEKGWISEAADKAEDRGPDGHIPGQQQPQHDGHHRDEASADAAANGTSSRTMEATSAFEGDRSAPTSVLVVVQNSVRDCGSPEPAEVETHTDKPVEKTVYRLHHETIKFARITESYNKVEES